MPDPLLCSIMGPKALNVRWLLAIQFLICLVGGGAEQPRPALEGGIVPVHGDVPCPKLQREHPRFILGVNTPQKYGPQRASMGVLV